MTPPHHYDWLEDRELTPRERRIAAKIAARKLAVTAEEAVEDAKSKIKNIIEDLELREGLKDLD